jgi:predicted transcriptional regulator
MARRPKDPLEATTVKLPVELKQRIAAVIEGSGMTMHAFLVRAIEEQAARAERRKQFVDAAVAARDEFDRTGVAYAAEDVHEWIRARARRTKAAKPKPRSWRK